MGGIVSRVVAEGRRKFSHFEWCVRGDEFLYTYTEIFMGRESVICFGVFREMYFRFGVGGCWMLLDGNIQNSNG